MSVLKISRRTIVVFGLVGMAVVASATQASAFGGFGGGRGMGGGLGGGRGMGGGLGGGMSGMRPLGVNVGGLGQRPLAGRPLGGLGGRPLGLGGRPLGGLGGRPLGRPGQVMCVRAPCNIGRLPPPVVRHPPFWNCRFTHSCGPRPVSCRFYPYARFCGWRPPIYYPRPVFYPRPVYTAPVYGAYRAAAPAYSAPAPAPAVCVPPGPFISVVFQVNATAGDIAGFLNNYTVQMADGPNNDGVFRLKLTSPMSRDQVNAMIESMRGQTNVVSQVNG